MKKKLICVLFMIAGAATIAVAVFLLLGRWEHHDASPVYTLIILSVIMIIAAASHINEPDAPEVSGREKLSLWVYRAACIFAILVCFAFVVIALFLTDHYDDMTLSNIFLLMIPAVIGVIAAALGLKVRPPFYRQDITKAVVALAMAGALCFAYFSCMPKYSQADGVKMLRSDDELAQMDVYYTTSYSYGNGRVSRNPEPRNAEMFGFNPFYDELFVYHCDSYTFDAGGLHGMKGFILFDPATGAHKYSRAQNRDQDHSPGELPELNCNLVYDRDGQHDPVLNLYFREWFPYPEEHVRETDQRAAAVGSSEWDAKIMGLIYPCNFPVNEVRLYLKSIDEKTLKSKISEKIAEADTAVALKLGGRYTGLVNYAMEGRTVKIYFFGTEIAAVSNGQIVLKL